MKHTLQFVQGQASKSHVRKLMLSLPIGVLVYFTEPGTFIREAGERFVKHKGAVVQEMRLGDIDFIGFW